MKLYGIVIKMAELGSGNYIGQSNAAFASKFDAGEFIINQVEAAAKRVGRDIGGVMAEITIRVEDGK